MIRFGVTLPSGQRKWLGEEGHKVIFASGFDSVTELATSACANGVGVNIEGDSKPSRIMQLKIVPGGNDAEDGRYKLFNLMPSGTERRFLIRTDVEDYYIYATVTAFEVSPFSEQVQKQVVTVTLTATDPLFYLLTPTSETKTISATSPAVFSCNNDGEATGFKLTVKTNTTSSNSMMNPIVKLGSDTLKFILNISTGGSLIINTVKGSKSAKLTYSAAGGTVVSDVIPKRADGSTFIQLPARSVSKLTVNVEGTGTGTAKLEYKQCFDFI